MGDTVTIGKTVSYESLEAALLAAAEEIGWKARVEDIFDRNYTLGSVQAVRDYRFTMVHLRGKVLPAMKVFILNKKPCNRFHICRGFPHGFASERRVQEYLSAVSGLL